MIETLEQGGIRFYTGVAGARVYINSPGMPIWQYIFKGYTDATGVFNISVPVGTNKYMISKTGYKTASGSVMVYDGETSIVYVNMVTLSAMDTIMIGNLEIISPAGAVVYINDSIQQMFTPVTITDLPQGDYVLTLVKNDREYTTFATVVTNITSTISINLE